MSDDDKLSFLDQQAAPEAQEPQSAPEPDPQPVETTEPEPAQKAPEREAEPQSADPAKPGYVPLDALLSEREKRKDYERRLSEIEQRNKQAETKAPDPIDDAEGYNRYIEQRLQQNALETKLTTSEYMLRERIGEAEFSKLQEWWLQSVAKDSPHLVQQGTRHPSPWAFAYDQFKRNSVLSEVGSDLDAYRQKIIAEERAKWEAERAAAAPAEPMQSTPRQPPPSLASRPQAADAKAVPTGPGQAFDQAIKR